MRHLLATYEVAEEAVEDVKGHVREFIESSRREMGCIYYDAFQDAENPTRFHHAMGFKHESALVEHQKSMHTTKFIGSIYKVCTDPPAYTILRAIITPNVEEAPDFEDDDEA